MIAKNLSVVSVRSLWLIRVLVQVVYLAQADEGQVGVDVVEDAGLAGNHVGQTSGGDHLGEPAQLALDAPDQPLDQFSISQDQPGLQRRRGVLPDDGGRRRQLDAP